MANGATQSTALAKKETPIIEEEPPFPITPSSGSRPPVHHGLRSRDGTKTRIFVPLREYVPYEVDSSPVLTIAAHQKSAMSATHQRLQDTTRETLMTEIAVERSCLASKDMIEFLTVVEGTILGREPLVDRDMPNNKSTVREKVNYTENVTVQSRDTIVALCQVAVRLYKSQVETLAMAEEMREMLIRADVTEEDIPRWEDKGKGKDQGALSSLAELKHELESLRLSM
jgi:hypothetical protein